MSEIQGAFRLGQQDGKTDADIRIYDAWTGNPWLRTRGRKIIKVLDKELADSYATGYISGWEVDCESSHA